MGVVQGSSTFIITILSCKQLTNIQQFPASPISAILFCTWGGGECMRRAAQVQVPQFPVRPVYALVDARVFAGLEGWRWEGGVFWRIDAT
jgi:hypothetical protein